MSLKNGFKHMPDADEELDPVEAADLLEMTFQGPLPERNCFGCPDNVSDEYCAACQSRKDAEQEGSQDRVRLFFGKNTPKSPRDEMTLAAREAVRYARSASPTYRGKVLDLVLKGIGRQVVI